MKYGFFFVLYLPVGSGTYLHSPHSASHPFRCRRGPYLSQDDHPCGKPALLRGRSSDRRSPLSHFSGPCLKCVLRPDIGGTEDEET